MTFKELKFQQHPNRIQGAVQAKHTFDNGVTISVVGGGQGLYGDGEQSFEVGAWDKNHDWIRLSEHDDVIGWQSEEDVNLIIEKLEKL